MKNTHELEDDLRERWLKSYPDDKRKAFCFDGLCYNGEIYNDGKNAHQGNEEKLWNNTDRRILFLMKEFFGLFLKHSDIITRVTVWGVTDGDSWKNNFPVPGRVDYPLLFDRDCQPKPFVEELIGKHNI